MSRVCQVTGKRPRTGNKVSHSNIKKRRRFLPNLHTQRFWLESEGRWVTLAREYLATMADVRRVLGDDLDGIDLHATADGKGRSRAEAETRLARMLGRDRTTLPPEALAAAATWIREQQRRSIMDGVMLVASASPLPPGAPVVAAGIGASEVERLARELDRTCLPFGALAGASDAVRRDATHHAPAVAVALLAARASSV